MIGEMLDRESIAIALEAADAGHLGAEQYAR